LQRHVIPRLSNSPLTVVLSNFSFVKNLMWKDLVDRTETLKRSPAGLASSRGEFDLAPDKGAGCAHLLPVLFETLRRQRLDNPLIDQCRPHRFCDRDAAPVRRRSVGRSAPASPPSGPCDLSAQFSSNTKSNQTTQFVFSALAMPWRTAISARRVPTSSVRRRDFPIRVV
jgi:hypothetical protein